MDAIRLLPGLNEQYIFLLATVFIFSACVGSFLNVVIYRLPLMMQREWRQNAQEYLELEVDASDTDSFNLAFPNSHCPSCNAAIPIWHNLPILSYIILRGRCSSCAANISCRYPLVELLTGITGVLLLIAFGLSAQFCAALLMSFAFICLVGIDADHMLLPDSITLPLIWFGLLINTQGVFVPLESAVFGAVAGYLSLWSFYWIFKIATNKEGMGAGDFKLLAAIGAVGGWQILLDVVLLSSVVGAVYGLVQVVFSKENISKPMPYGPFLACAGWLMIVYPSIAAPTKLIEKLL